MSAVDNFEAWQTILHGEAPTWLGDREWTVMQGRIGYRMTYRAIGAHLGLAPSLVRDTESRAERKRAWPQQRYRLVVR